MDSWKGPWAGPQTVERAHEGSWAGPQNVGRVHFGSWTHETTDEGPWVLAVVPMDHSVDRHGPRWTVMDPHGRPWTLNYVHEGP